MSTPPRRRSRRLAAAAAAAAHCPLTDLPLELLARVISRCDPVDIARVAAVSLLFHASLALEGIRLWARERGFELPALRNIICRARPLCFGYFRSPRASERAPFRSQYSAHAGLQAPSPRSHTHACGQAAQLGAAKQGIPEPDARAESWGFRSG